MPSLTIARAQRRLRRYRQQANAVTGPKYASVNRLRVELDGYTLCSADSWDTVCKMAIDAWLWEDRARASFPKCWARYGQYAIDRCQFCFPGKRLGTMTVVAAGNTWEKAFQNFLEASLKFRETEGRKDQELARKFQERIVSSR